MDLGVGQVGVIIDDGVDEGMSQQRLVMLVLPRRGGLTVPVTVLTTDKAPVPAIGAVAKLLGVNVDQADRGGRARNDAPVFPGSFDLRQPVQPGRGQDPMER